MVSCGVRDRLYLSAGDIELLCKTHKGNDAFILRKSAALCSVVYDCRESIEVSKSRSGFSIFPYNVRQKNLEERNFKIRVRNTR